MTTPIASNFVQLNLVAVIQRANTILRLVRDLQLSNETILTLAETTMKDIERLDHWEHAAWSLVVLEIMERNIRTEDPQTESAPPNWNGGFATVTLR